MAWKGSTVPVAQKKLTVNPERWASELGSDFVRNSDSPNIDFASVHIYPDHWFHDQGFEEKLKFVVKWMLSHIEDGDKELKKPVLFTEFGLSNLNKDYDPSQRDRFYRTIFDVIYKSAKRKRSGAGTLVWQFLIEGMEGFNDDFGIVPWEQDSIQRLMIEQSCRLSRITGRHLLDKKSIEMCSHRP